MADRPMPRSIGVCALIALRSDPSSPLFDIEFNPHRQDTLSIFLENSVLYPSPLDSLFDWITALRRAVDDDVVELLVETLSMAAESVDALVDLMESLQAAVLTEGLMDAVSVHGVYLRQVCLGFDELPFESVTCLWHELCHQLDRLVQSPLNPSDPQSTSIRTSTTSSSSPSPPWPLSTPQVEELLQDTCRRMLGLDPQQPHQQHEAMDDSSSSYEQTELHVRSMLERVPDVSAAYFVRFLNCLRHKDRTALDALHQFFDHAMIQKQTTTTGTTTTSPTTTTTASSKEILQYSAILLALVHDSFGDSNAALMATEEAVRVAQQSKDATCVAFALGKLFEHHKGQQGTTAGRRELLQRCLARASQEQIRPLVSGSSLGLSVDYLRDSTRDPATVWRHHMDALAEPSADSIPHWDRPTYLSASPHETIHGMVRQTLVEAGIWNSLGAPSLSGLASLTLLNCHHGRSASSPEDRIAALINVAEQTQYGSPASLLLLPGQSHGGEDSSLHERLREARSAHGVGGKSWDEAFLPAILLQAHRQCMARRDLENAKALESILYSSLPPEDSQNSPLALEMGIQQCRRLCRSNDHIKARELARNLLELPDLEGSHRARLLLAAAEIELAATTTTNSPHYVMALPPLLEALAMCEQESSSMHDVHCVGLLLLSKVFLKDRNPRRALSILQATLPDLLSRASSTHQAEAYLTQAKCYLQWAEEDDDDDDGRTSSMPKNQRYRAALTSLHSSERLFQQRQVNDEYPLTEVYYLQARLWNLLGRRDECERASQRFLELQERKRPANDMSSLNRLIPMAMVS